MIYGLHYLFLTSSVVRLFYFQKVYVQVEYLYRESLLPKVAFTKMPMPMPIHKEPAFELLQAIT